MIQRKWIGAAGVLFFFVLLISGCRQSNIELAQYDYRIPRVLFLTTGDGRGEGTVSDGAIIALQAFNKLGAFVRFENRTILWDPRNLQDYDIIIAPTLFGYHDADRQYSLTYMSDRELAVLKDWVENGGVLVAGENFGRNRLDGIDRVTLTGNLSPENWVLSPVLGVSLQEVDVKGFRLSAADFLSHHFPNPPVLRVEQSAYLLVPADSASLALMQDSTRFRVWFYWQDVTRGTMLPAVFAHRYGKGSMVYFSVSRLLHPALDGGLAGSLQIEHLYQRIFRLAVGERRYPITLNPWPHAAQAALAVTFDDGGVLEEYKRVFTNLFPYINRISLFITGYTPPEVIQWCANQSQIELHNHSLTHPRFRGLDYMETLREIRQPEIQYQRQFTGFRFPYVVNSFWGMLVLEEQGYSFESSIVVDHTRFYGGGIFPYNIPIFHQSGWFRSLNLLEISPLQHDDWYFYGKGINEQSRYPEFQQKRDAARYRAYLQNLWNEVITPEKGIMTIVAHPLYSGKNQLLFSPILELTREVSGSGKYWLPSLQMVADYWNKRKNLVVEVAERENEVRVKIRLPREVRIPGLTLQLPRRPKHVVITRGEGTVKMVDGTAYYVFQAQNGTGIRFVFD